MAKKMKAISVFAVVMLFWGGIICYAQESVRTGITSLVPTGVRTRLDALAPSLRKWYIPQELYYQYQWEGWEYSNYAKEHYKRYVDVELEGRRYYDIYGNYVTKGWLVYNWTQDQPGRYRNQLRKSPKFSSWFDNVVVSAVSKGEYYSALTIGDEIRTTLTPLTFSKPAFNGIQWDFLSDKYAATVLASRISAPGYAVPSEEWLGENLTHFTTFFGLRGTVQLGGFMNIGATYVNAHHEDNSQDLRSNSLRGILSGPINEGWIEKIIIRISDDSPEDLPGATLYREEIWIDGKYHPEVEPVIDGGLWKEGVYEVGGNEYMTLTYNIKDDFIEEYDYKQIRRIEFVLVLANDYSVEVTSNMQTNVSGEPVFLPVVRAEGNVKDGSNQRAVRFEYGLPTGNEIYGVTLEVKDVMGFDVRAEYDINRRFRRFPNKNIPGIVQGKKVRQHSLAMDRCKAFYAQVSKIAYPWFGYLEIFNIDDAYTTWFFVRDKRGDVDYESEATSRFEFVDDNDDQDRFQDWRRVYQPTFDRAVFPGLDENNDLVSDFNQNDNFLPDYAEPFLRYYVDPPEFLFGMDMNNNTVIDRFEDDHLPDYPYKGDHRGYNVYAGVEIVPEVRLTIGRLDERLISDNKRSRSVYGLFTLAKDYPRIGRLQIFNMAKRVKDDIPDIVYLWVQPEASTGISQKFNDPLLCKDTFVNSAYVQFDYIGLPRLNVVNKLKYERYDQRRTDRKDSWFFGVINKAAYRLDIGGALTIQPKWKSMYSRQTSSETGGLQTHEIFEIGFLTLKYSILKNTWIDLGAEYTLFYNLIDRPAVPTPGYMEDFRGTVFCVQLSNVSDYLGYRLTTNLGFQWQKKTFEAEEEVSTVFFVRTYAGIE